MKVVLVSSGTRGDMQPFVCVASALAERDHEVEVVLPSDGEPMARAAGIPYRGLPMDIQSLMCAPEAQQMLAAGRSSALFRWLGEREREFSAGIRHTLIDATESADLIVSNVMLEARSRAIAEARQVPVVPMHLCPLIPSRAYPSPLLTQHGLGPLNRVSHELPFQMFWRAQRDDLKLLHRQLGLRAPTRSSWKRGLSGEHPCLLAYSQTLFPKPPDWPGHLLCTGFIHPSKKLRERMGEVGIPPDLEAWLRAGPPPVFLGFGSMPVLDQRAMLRTIEATLAKLNLRGIVAAGWSEVDTASSDALFIIDRVDHQALLPRCRAAVHHGGSGTTAASLGAGLPTLICWVFADQPFWGGVCRQLGVGDTFPFTKLDSRRLVRGLRAVLAPEVARRAVALSQRMAGEDGTGTAVTYLCDGPQSEGGFNEGMDAGRQGRADHRWIARYRRRNGA